MGFPWKRLVLCTLTYSVSVWVCLCVCVDLCVYLQHPKHSALNIAVHQNLKPRRQHLTSQNKQKRQLKESSTLLASDTAHADKASVRNKNINVKSMGQKVKLFMIVEKKINYHRNKYLQRQINLNNKTQCEQFLRRRASWRLINITSVCRETNTLNIECHWVI